MPEFSNPFSGNKSEKMLSKSELSRAIRFSIASEFEAIQLYEQLAESIEDEQVKKMLIEIAGDEKEHVGNFLHVLKVLEPEEKNYYESGVKEAEKIMNRNE